MGGIFLSTVMYGNANCDLIRRAVKMSDGKIGVEFFAFELTDDETQLMRNLKKDIGTCAVTFHSPMIHAEPTAELNSVEETALFENWSKALTLCKEFGAKQIVFHTNNCYIEESELERKRENCKRNCLKLQKMCVNVGVDLLVETLALPCKGAPIFTDKEFVDFVNSNALFALVDVGHMNLNGYDYEFVVSALGDRIKAFHIHNNDGVSDSHDKISRGSFDFARFAALFKRFTPTADLVFEYIDVPDLTFSELMMDVGELSGQTRGGSDQT